MKVNIIVVAAHHTISLPLLLDNLKWALEGVDYDVDIFTFKHWGLKLSACNCRVHETDVPVTDWYEFYHSEIENHVKKNIDQYDATILIEQDIWYKKKIKEILTEAVSKEEIKMEYAAPYFSIFDINHNLVYPRMWEGGIIYPNSILKKAFNLGVKLGYTIQYSKDLKDKFKDIYFFERRKHKDNTESISVYDKILKYGDLQMDTGVDLTIYCYENSIPVEILCGSIEFAKCHEIKNRLCYHYGCPERLHRYSIGYNCPELYDSPTLDLFKQYFLNFKYMWSNTIFALFVSDTISWSEEIEKIFFYDGGNFKQIQFIDEEIENWMPVLNLNKVKFILRKISKFY